MEEMRAMGLDSAFVSELEAFRNRPTGRHILRMFKEERLRFPEPTAAQAEAKAKAE